MNLAEKKQLVKLNKNHNGKEFRSFFHFVGKVAHTSKFENGQRVQQPFAVADQTQTGKLRRKIQFNLWTDQTNELKLELTGYENDFAYLYNQTEGKSQSIKFEDRFDKSKYPNESYHLIEQDWDKVERIAKLLKEDIWVEVKGHYEFGSFVDSERGKVYFRKRIVDDFEIIEDGQEIKAGNKVILDKYVTDFESEEFNEVNFVSMQIGINSTYREEGKQDTKINAYFLDYGKARSVPHQTELIVPHVETEEGATTLADAFLNLKKFDFVEINGTDNNRAILAAVEVETPEIKDDPFANLSENATVKRTKNTVIGRVTGIHVLSIVDGTFVRDFLTKEEVEEVQLNGNNTSNNDSNDDNPFKKVENKVEDDPFKESDPFAVNNDPFAN